MSAQTDVHLVPLDTGLFIALIKYLVSVYDLKFVFHLLFIGAIMQVRGIDCLGIVASVLHGHCNDLMMRVVALVLQARRRSLMVATLPRRAE